MTSKFPICPYTFQNSLGRKVMTNLDGILKSRDIALPTKVCLVKAMVFPVLVYGGESWKEHFITLLKSYKES